MPEVLLGAAVADQDGALDAARQIFTDHYWPFMQKFGVGPIHHSLHPKSGMSEMMGKYGCTVWKIQRLDSGDFKGVICAGELSLFLYYDDELADRSSQFTWSGDCKGTSRVAGTGNSSCVRKCPGGIDAGVGERYLCLQTRKAKSCRN